ncbi:MAG TPA: maleylpyruvate isomerase family mycothiol-dependent enzyme [Mycobacteriales bacterium]|jgi:uncharacterized protein (TIGR03083 family)|nr:maleylpyruvate isomerase family mycothiol-dependent enzyme [Mycobacteriales bacterium]
MATPASPDEVAAAWRGHRQRFRDWFATLDDAGWAGRSRCTEWTVRDIAQHLVSGSQFLGYTLHQALKGQPTRLLADFDAQETPKTTTSMFDGLSPNQLLDQLHAMDARVDAELQRLSIEGWGVDAEAPPGRVAAHVSVNHFLFDSWVHERDVMLPAKQTPTTEPGEAAAVASYVLALAGIARTVDEDPPQPAAIRVHLTDVDRHLCLTVTEAGSVVRFCPGDSSTNIAASAGALVDAATGRVVVASIDADAHASAVLEHLATAMS